VRNALFLALFILAALVCRAYITGSAWWLGIDDANIYYVYVQNILHGHGVVYTPGGELVEGFTSVLWLALLVIFSVGNVLSVEAAALLLSLACTFATLWLVSDAVHKQSGTLVAWCVVVVVLATPGVIDWMLIARLETPLWVLALTVAGLRMAYGPYDKWFFVALGLLPLIRPEGFILGPLVAIAACYVCHGATRNILLPALRCASVPIVVAALLTIVRMFVFGVPLPNTYYAKVSSSLLDNISAGVAYLGESALSAMWVPLLAFLLVIAVIVRKKNIVVDDHKKMIVDNTAGTSVGDGAIRSRYALIILVLSILLLPLLTGGDHFTYARFQIPAVFFIWMMVGREFTWTQRRLMSVAVVLLLMSVNAVYLVRHKGGVLTLAPNALRLEYTIARDGRMEAEAMEQIHKGGPLPRWGVTAAGGIGYAYDGECIDLLGLNNPRMARANKRKVGVLHGHSSFNAEVFFEQRPDVICAFTAKNDSLALIRYQWDWGWPTSSNYFMHDNIVEHPRFKREYALARLTANGVSIYGLVRKDWPRKAPTVSFAFLH